VCVAERFYRLKTNVGECYPPGTILSTQKLPRLDNCTGSTVEIILNLKFLPHVNVHSSEVARMGNAMVKLTQGG
jgi:hypothetical protein